MDNGIAIRRDPLDRHRATSAPGRSRRVTVDRSPSAYARWLARRTYPFLAREPVEVLDRGEVLGSSSCSWYAGGMLAPWCELESAEPLVARLGGESLAWWRRRFAGTTLNGSLVVAHARDAAELFECAD